MCLDLILEYWKSFLFQTFFKTGGIDAELEAMGLQSMTHGFIYKLLSIYDEDKNCSDCCLASYISLLTLTSSGLIACEVWHFFVRVPVINGVNCYPCISFASNVFQYFYTDMYYD